MKTLIKLSKKLTIVLTLLSLFVPTTLTLINVNAQELENKQIHIEIIKKDGSREVKTTTTNEVVNNPIINAPSEEELPQLELDETRIKELETSQAIVYDKNSFASLNVLVLQRLDYSQSEVEKLQKMVDYYNSTPVKEIKTTTKAIRSNSASFGIQISAGCEWETNLRWHATHLELWLNNCLIEDIKINSVGGAAVAKIAGLEPTPFGELVVLYLGIYIAVLDGKNGQCDNQGANLNIPYVSSSLMWVSSVC